MITQWTRPIALVMFVMGSMLLVGGDWWNALGSGCFVISGYVLGRTEAE